MSDDFPRDAQADSDPAVQESVRRALADLTFLRPDAQTEPSETGAERMPDWAWARLSNALAAESGNAPVRRPSRILRWGGGLAAAAVAAVAVGVGVTAFQGSDPGATVAADSPAAADSLAAAPAPGMEAAASATPGVLTKNLALAGIVPPTLHLVDSDTDYTREDLRRQVTDVLADNGMATTTQAVATAMSLPPADVEMSAVPSNGFTRTLADLRACITALTRQADSTALLVDRSTFEGADAGVVVTSPETPTMTRLQIVVIDPECHLVTTLWMQLGD